MVVDGKQVSMRKSDGWLNATEVLILAGKNESQRRRILNHMCKFWYAQEESFKGYHEPIWVSSDHGRLLCETFHLEEMLKPLLRPGTVPHPEVHKPQEPRAEEHKSQARIPLEPLPPADEDVPKVRRPQCFLNVQLSLTGHC